MLTHNCRHLGLRSSILSCKPYKTMEALCSAKTSVCSSLHGITSRKSWAFVMATVRTLGVTKVKTKWSVKQCSSFGETDNQQDMMWGLQNSNFIHSFIHSFIPFIYSLACAECDDSSPFSAAASILCCVLFPSTQFPQLVFHPSFAAALNEYNVVLKYT